MSLPLETSVSDKDHDPERSFVSRLDEVNIAKAERIFSSLPALNVSVSNHLRKINSEPNLYYRVNFDDLCGPWIYPDNPIYEKFDEDLVPKLCTWNFINQTDIVFFKEHQNNKENVLAFIESKLPDNKIFAKGINRKIFLSLIWEIFRYTRDNLFTEKGVAASLGLFFLVHRFFLSRLQRTADETQSFFYESLLLHSVMDPPHSDEVFSPKECELLMHIFWRVYLQQLPLIRLVCLPNYKLILKLK